MIDSCWRDRETERFIDRVINNTTNRYLFSTPWAPHDDDWLNCHVATLGRCEEDSDVIGPRGMSL